MGWFEIHPAAGLIMSTGKNNAWRNKGNDCQWFRELQGEFKFLNAHKNIWFSALITQILALAGIYSKLQPACVRGCAGGELTGKIPSIPSQGAELGARKITCTGGILSPSTCSAGGRDGNRNKCGNNI